MQTQTITLDVLKPIGTIVDLSDSFNARVGDQMTPLQLYITRNGMAEDLSGYHPELEGVVGNGAKNGNDVEMAPGAKGVHWVGSSKCVTGYNQLTLAFPAEVFPQSGFCYGHLLLINDDGVRESSVDVWFQVLDGTPLMGLVADHYDSQLKLELIKAQNMNKQFAEEMKETCHKMLSDVQASLLKNYDMLDQLSLSVGLIQSLINAGDVVPRTEYQKNKEVTDTQVDANTRELQSHDAQLKQLTASPSSDGTTEITDARIGSAEQSARTYTTLGEAIRDQAGQATRALKNSFEERYAFPYKKEDNATYSKDGKTSSTSGSIYYFNVAGVPLIRIRTKVEQYVNFFTFIDSSGNVLDYQRNDDKTTTVDFVVAPPAGAITLVLGAEPGTTNADDSVSVFDKGYEIGKFYQGSLTDDTHYIEHGPNRASLVIDSENYENLITANDDYQIWDDHLQSWVSQALIPQNSKVQVVIVKKSDNSDILSTEMYSHFSVEQIPKSELHLKSYRNGLTDISDIFNLSYNNILEDEKDSHYYFYSKDLPTGSRIASQFVTVDHNASWLIDLDDGYEVSFVTSLKDSRGQNIVHDFYNNTNVLKTAINWVGGHVYENLYTQGTYEVVFRKKDGSLIDINTIWDHVRIYEVDNAIHFPDYYRSHMQDRVDTINAKLTSPGNFGFGFITDVHAEFNTKHFPALIDEVRTKTPVNEFLGGGDWATAWFDSENDADNKPELFHFFEELQSLFKGVPLLKTVGNHELRCQ